MGPQWFFEGFAVYGSGQDLGPLLQFSNNQDALRATENSESPLAYRGFSAVVRYFVGKAPLHTLVERAGGMSFDVGSWGCSGLHRSS